MWECSQDYILTANFRQQVSEGLRGTAVKTP